MTISKFLRVLTFAVTAMSAGCTTSRTPAPPLQGPSALGLNLIITANPDVLSMDGASQSRINIEARDANGQLFPNQQLRAQIFAQDLDTSTPPKCAFSAVDFGSLNARTVVTGSNGQANVVYTAPPSVTGATDPCPAVLRIVINPAGTDANAGFDTSRFVAIRLVAPGVISGGGPNPSFTVTPAAPAAFTDVQFDASASTSSLGSAITGYAWSFGDGSTATGVTATHRFASSSTFHVVLTVTDSNGQAKSTFKDVSVGIGTAPKADFVFSPQSPVTGQVISFNGGVSTAGVGHQIVRWDWDFGTGSGASGVSVTKTYTAAGTYNVILTVTDEVGQTALATKPVTVASAASGSTAPTAQFTFSPAAPGIKETVFFNASTSTAGTGHTIASYSWSFGDGANCSTAAPAGCGAGTPAAPQHAYQTAGSYGVQLTVTDEIGQSSTSSPTTIAAGNPPAPTANFTFSPGLPGRFDNVVFDASSSTTAQGQTIVDVAWNFGDGTAVVHCGGVLFPNDPSCVNVGSTNRVSQHTFQTATTWQVNLVVTDSAGRTGSHPSPVTIALADPNVVITASPSTPTPGTQVNFNSDGTTYYSGSLPLAFPVSFSWTFGDGGSCSTANTLGCGTGTAADPNHIYLGVGTYGVGLSVTDNKGRTGVGNATVTVAAVVPPPPPVSPTASFTFGPTTVHAGVTSVLFDGSASKDSLGRSGPTATLTYVWNFGDGTPPTAPSAASTVNHTYAVLGPSSATLTVRDTVTGLSNTSAAQTVTVVP